MHQITQIFSGDLTGGLDSSSKGVENVLQGMHITGKEDKIFMFINSVGS